MYVLDTDSHYQVYALIGLFTQEYLGTPAWDNPSFDIVQVIAPSTLFKPNHLLPFILLVLSYSLLH